MQRAILMTRLVSEDDSGAILAELEILMREKKLFQMNISLSIQRAMRSALRVISCLS
ncbi:MAG TPA: hypothetical protein PKK43_13075 [Spirochaetota bacterium]|nr:hypothetical protein [Spirochaetota bacterium]